MVIGESVARTGAMWGSAAYERLAERFAWIHDQLVERLDPAPGERWLDVATGTGEVAVRAARAGAEVTGVDISEPLLARARTSADAERLPVRLELGDAQELPYADESFDVVASCFGAIFAPDHRAVARELSRVCRRGGRLGLTAWQPKPEIERIYERFQERRPASDAEAWGEPDRVYELLGESFELTVEEGVWRLEGASAAEVFEFMASSAPPMKAFLETLDPDRRGAFREAMLAHWERYRNADGVSEPRPYLLILGRRR